MTEPLRGGKVAGTQITAPRVALAGVSLEANAFAAPTTRADFERLCCLRGMEILSEAAKPAPAMPLEMVAFIRRWAMHGSWIPVPILVTAAEPGGPLEQEAFEGFVAEIVAGLKQAGPVDAVYLSNHGAMTATETADAEAVLVAAVRQVVGLGVPIVVTLDLHANISEAMVRSIDLPIGYLTNPHVDQLARGTEAADGMMRLLAGEKFHSAYVKLPLMPPTVTLLTAAGPYAELIALGQKAAKADPAILNVTILAGFAFADVPQCGMSVIVTGAYAAAETLAHRLADLAWGARQRFVPKLVSIEDAVGLARAAASDPGLPAVLLADVADNPGGGGTGNTTFILEALQVGGVTGALLGTFCDPKLAEEAHVRGIGKKFNVVFNRGGHLGYVRRFMTEGIVVGLSDGRCVGSPGSIYAGRGLDLGPMAAIDIGGITVVVTSARKQGADPVFFTMLGLDPATARVVVVKSRGHFRAGFASLFRPEQIHEVDAAGLTSPVLSNFDFKQVPRPIYPLDPDMQWQRAGD